MKRAFKWIVALEDGYDYRTRMCVLPASRGSHERLVVTHPNKKPVIVDMKSRRIETLG